MLSRSATAISSRSVRCARLTSTRAVPFVTTRKFASSEVKMADLSPKPFNTEKATQPVGPYSQACFAGPNIYVSGQLPADASGKIVEGSIGDMTKACCENIKAILEGAGSSVSKIVKVNVFLTSMDNFPAMNDVYAQYFTHKPARSTVAVKELPKGVPVEIECIALA